LNEKSTEVIIISMNKTLVAIVTAECGEPQFEKQKELLEKQNNVIIEHFVISNKSSLEAEYLIHHYAREASKMGIEWVIRLDGDMVPLDANSISNLLLMAKKLDSNQGRLTLPVQDYYTNRQIFGVHVIKSNFVPITYQKKNFKPEQWIDNIPGLTIKKVSPPPILHGFDPDINQAIRFGLHRGIKAREVHKNGGHWLTILDIYDAYKKDRTELRESILTAALLGVGYVGIQKLQWESVDFNSDLNKFVLDEIKNNNYSNVIQSFTRIKFFKYHKSLCGSPKGTTILVLKYIHRKIGKLIYNR